MMVCCADDVQYKGMLCLYDKAEKYKSGDWIILTAKITFEKHRLYRDGKGPVLYANTVKASEAPEKEVAEF